MNVNKSSIKAIIIFLALCTAILVAQPSKTSLGMPLTLKIRGFVYYIHTPNALEGGFMHLAIFELISREAFSWFGKTYRLQEYKNINQSSCIDPAGSSHSR